MHSVKQLNIYIYYLINLFNILYANNAIQNFVIGVSISWSKYKCIFDNYIYLIYCKKFILYLLTNTLQNHVIDVSTLCLYTWI